MLKLTDVGPGTFLSGASRVVQVDGDIPDSYVSPAGTIIKRSATSSPYGNASPPRFEIASGQPFMTDYIGTLREAVEAYNASLTVPTAAPVVPASSEKLVLHAEKVWNGGYDKSVLVRLVSKPVEVAERNFMHDGLRLSFRTFGNGPQYTDKYQGPTLYIEPGPPCIVPREVLPKIKAAVRAFNARNERRPDTTPPGVELIE